MRLLDVDLLPTMLMNGADPNAREIGERLREAKFNPTEENLIMAAGDLFEQAEDYAIDFLSSLCEQDEEHHELCGEMLELLLKHGADPFARHLTTTVLHRIMGRIYIRSLADKRVYVFRALIVVHRLDIKCCDNAGMTLLVEASIHGSLEIFKKPLDSGSWS